MSQNSIGTERKSRKPDIRPERSRAGFRAALVDLLNERSFDEITVRDIANRAGQGYATLFRHYRDKADLLDDVIGEFLGHVHRATSGIFQSADGKLSAEVLCQAIADNRLQARVLLTGGASATVREQFVTRATELAMQYRSKRADALPGNLGITHSLDAVVGILSWWLGEEPDRTMAEVASLIDQLVFQPVDRYRKPGEEE